MGLVDYTNYDDMKYAIRKLDDSEFRNPFSRSYIRVRSYEGSMSRSEAKAGALVGAEALDGVGASQWEGLSLDHHQNLFLQDPDLFLLPEFQDQDLGRGQADCARKLFRCSQALCSARDSCFALFYLKVINGCYCFMAAMLYGGDT